ncbi:hypothetical protein Pint_01898 [Pistacia integerrima]|uniref:Uncharacterized protein n=1 Tax=Pistacia integerrima TaxID=434235 RepID=A0ACC0ZHM9_9ROSI|nr:hypothetical protein Pint_01898 [Pistacia integerrima]
MEYLPPEVVVNILSRLPITSLLQCKLVCRAWRSLSKDPHLVSMRFSCVGKNDPSLILHCDYPIQNQLYSLDLSAHDEDNLRVNKICVPTLPEYEVIGSCKGLLCLCDSLTKTQFYIYNPFTRDHKQLLKSIEFPIREVAFRFRFGSHPITKEYKVLNIVYHRTKPRTVRNPVQIYRPESQVQIFTLGFIGRLGHRGMVQIARSSPLDLADEQFRVVPKPTCGGLDGCSFSLVALGGCLSAAVSHKNGQIEIWVMKDYDVKESWTKDFSIGTHVPRGLEKKVPKSFRASKFLNHFPIIRVLCLMKNGNILLVYKGRALVSYDKIMGTFRDIMFDGMPNWFEAVVHEGENDPCLILHYDYPTQNQLYLIELSPHSKDNQRMNRIHVLPLLEFDVLGSCKGFVFHQTTKEYKVITVVYCKPLPPPIRHIQCREGSLISPKSEVQILDTLRSPAWRSIGRIPYRLYQRPSQVLVNGRLHWRGKFDLVVLGGCLSEAFQTSYCQLEIWVMKDYDVKESWIKEFSIGVLVPRGFEQDLNHKSRVLVSYDPKNGTFKQLLFRGMPNWFQAFVHEVQTSFQWKVKSFYELYSLKLSALNEENMEVKRVRVPTLLELDVDVCSGIRSSNFRYSKQPCLEKLGEIPYRLYQETSQVLTSNSKFSQNLNVRVGDLGSSKITIGQQAQTENLPQDIVLEIFSRLPAVTSLLQFKLVCRAWHNLVQDPLLVTMHFPRRGENVPCLIENDPCLILYFEYPIRNQLYSLELSSLNEDSQKVNMIRVPILPEFYVVTKTSLHICNPFTGDYIELPKSKESLNQQVLFRFGFHNYKGV